MATLAIRGHATRGKEVIELLEMLGGKKIKDTPIFDTCNYFITNGVIAGKSIFDFTFSTYKIFTLEEFLEKFPYKVGDRVSLSIGGTFTVKSMYWCSETNSMRYKVNGLEVDVSALKPYIEEETEEETIVISKEQIEQIQAGRFVTVIDEQEEETMEETKKNLDWHPTDYLEFVDNDEFADEVELNLGDSYEILLKDGKYFAVKKKPQSMRILKV